MSGRESIVLLAANPRSGSGAGASKVAVLEQQLTSAGLTVEVCRDLEKLRVLSAKWFADGTLKAVVSAGGDGTACAVANLIPHGAPMTVLPLGTENLLAKCLGFTGEWSRPQPL